MPVVLVQNNAFGLDFRIYRIFTQASHIVQFDPMTRSVCQSGQKGIFKFSVNAMALGALFFLAPNKSMLRSCRTLMLECQDVPCENAFMWLTERVDMQTLTERYG